MAGHGAPWRAARSALPSHVPSQPGTCAVRLCRIIIIILTREAKHLRVG